MKHIHFDVLPPVVTQSSTRDSILTQTFFQRYSNHALFAALSLSALLYITYAVTATAYFIIALVVIIVCTLGVIRPTLTYWLVVITLLWQVNQVQVTYSDHIAVTYFIFQIILIATLVGYLVQKVCRIAPSRPAYPMDGFIFLLLFIEILGTFWAVDPVYSLFFHIFMIFNVLLYFLTTTYIQTKEALDRLLKVLIFTGILISFCMILNLWIDVEYQINLTDNVKVVYGFSSVVQRLSGYASAQHGSGFIVFLLFLISAVAINDKNQKKRILYLLITLLLLVALVLSVARGSLLGLIVLVPVYVFLDPYFASRRWRTIAIAFAVILFVIIVAKPTYIQRIMLGFGYSGEMSGAQFYRPTNIDVTKGQGLTGWDTRIYRYDMALTYMAKHPLTIITGLGPGGFIAVQDFDPMVTNVVLALLFELGLMGIFLLFFLLYSLGTSFKTAYNCQRFSHTQRIMLASFCGLLAEIFVHGQFEYDWNAIGSQLIYFYIAVFMSIRHVVVTENNSSSQSIAETVPHVSTEG